MSGNGWDALRALFVRRLHERLAVMTETLNLFEAGDRSAPTALERQFHSLAGIAGTFGHPDITETAREGERRCGTGSTDGIAAIVSNLRARAAGVGIENNGQFARPNANDATLEIDNLMLLNDTGKSNCRNYGDFRQ